MTDKQPRDKIWAWALTAALAALFITIVVWRMW